MIKEIPFLLVGLLLSISTFSQIRKNSKVETYFEKCCVNPDTLRKEYNLKYKLLIYKPQIDSCEVYLESEGIKMPLKIISMKTANYYAVGVNDSSVGLPYYVSIRSLGSSGRFIRFKLDAGYFFIRTAFLSRGWILEYTNTQMTTDDNIVGSLVKVFP